jgi:hypothetical protein
MNEYQDMNCDNRELDKNYQDQLEINLFIMIAYKLQIHSWPDMFSQIWQER